MKGSNMVGIQGLKITYYVDAVYAACFDTRLSVSGVVTLLAWATISHLPLAKS